MHASYSYQSKLDRLAELHDKDIRAMVEKIVAVTILVTKPAQFTSVVGSITGALKMSNKIDGTKTAAEMLAIVSDTDLFDIYKDSKYESLQLVSNYTLTTATLNFIKETKYLPPMVVPPNVVEKNYDYMHLTEPTSMILGKGNHHDGDICLDSINKFNTIPLSLNIGLLKELSERPNRELIDLDKKKQWLTFVRDSYSIYKALIDVGNTFYLGHKTDCRGRTYSQGYHLNTQANEFRKAIIEFKDKELIQL